MIVIDNMSKVDRDLGILMEFAHVRTNKGLSFDYTKPIDGELWVGYDTRTTDSLLTITRIYTESGIKKKTTDVFNIRNIDHATGTEVLEEEKKDA